MMVVAAEKSQSLQIVVQVILYVMYFTENNRGKYFRYEEPTSNNTCKAVIGIVTK